MKKMFISWPAPLKSGKVYAWLFPSKAVFLPEPFQVPPGRKSWFNEPSEQVAIVQAPEHLDSVEKLRGWLKDEHSYFGLPIGFETPMLRENVPITRIFYICIGNMAFATFENPRLLLVRSRDFVTVAESVKSKLAEFAARGIEAVIIKYRNEK